MVNDLLVRNSGVTLIAKSTTPLLFTPLLLLFILAMSFQGMTHSSSIPPPLRRRRHKVPKDMEDHRPVLLPVKGPYMRDVAKSPTEEHLTVFLRTRTTTAVPQSPYMLRPYRNPLPEIGQQKVSGDEQKTTTSHTGDDATAGMGTKNAGQTAVDANNSSPQPTDSSEAAGETQEEEDKKEGEEEEKKKEGEEGGEADEENAKSAKEDLENGEDEVEGDDESEVDYEGIVARMKSDIIETRLQATAEARKQLVKERYTIIEGFVDAGILEHTVESLKINFVKLQQEASWIIASITKSFSEHIKAVAESGAIEPLVKLLSSPDQLTRDKSILALGNIAEDSEPLTIQIIQAGLLPTLLDILKKKNNSVSFLRHSSWTLTSLTHLSSPELEPKDLDFILKEVQLLLENTDEEILSNCLWTLSNISGGSNSGIQMVIDAGLVPRIVKLVDNKNVRKIGLPALRACGNVTTGTDEQTDTVLEAEILPYLKDLLDNGSLVMQKEAGWVLSNILAGTEYQAQKAIDSGILPLLVKAAKTEALSVRRESIWAITNLTTLGYHNQILSLVEAGGIGALLSVLQSALDEMIVPVSLEGLTNIINATKDEPEFTKVLNDIRTNGGVDILEVLSFSENQEVRNTANSILDRHFFVSESFEEQDDFESLEYTNSDEGRSNRDSKMSQLAHKYLPKESDSEDDEKKENDG